MSAAVDEFMSEKQFLAWAKICRATLNKFKSRGLITYYKCGRRILYDQESMRTFKENCARRIESSRPDEHHRRVSVATSQHRGIR
jgi:hypothetical protein